MAQQDATTLLDDDHNEVIRLFEQYKAARDDAKKRVLAQQILHELAVHTRVEEEIFYPAFARATGQDELVDEGEREHQEARELMARIEQSPANARLMLALEDAILHHVNDEREKMFPAARKAKNLDLAQLAQRLEARKAELTAGHPA